MHPSDDLSQAPHLRRLKQQGLPPPEPPEGYFDAMAQAWDDRLADESALAEAPQLRQAGRTLPLRVPAGYFEALPARVMQRIRAEATLVRPLWPTLAYRAVAVAAVLGLLLMMWRPQPRPEARSTPTLTWGQLPTEALLALAEEEVDDPALILEVLNEATAPQPPPETEAIDLLLEDMDVADLEAVWLETE